MSTLITENFLLTTPEANRLFHEFAATEPIYDYHTHLPVDEIAADKRFDNIADLWLGGDHYKWRAMRANGVPESHITGDAPPKEKFMAWAATVPHTLRNPLFHWVHLELKRVFGIDELLGPDTAEDIWNRANYRLGDDDFSVRGLLKKFRVSVVCSTDDPADDLEHHRFLANEGTCPTKVYPTFRPDAALRVDQPESFHIWLEKLSAVSGVACDTLPGLMEALARRHEFFHDNGARLSDHGLPYCYAEPCDAEMAARVFDLAKSGMVPAEADIVAYRSFMMRYFGHLDAEKDWCKQLHLGPLRNNNSHLFASLGTDIGCDSMDDLPQAASLNRYLDYLDREGHLPKMVVYNLNPKDNYAIATAIGNFQGRSPGRLQFGSGWWFLDSIEGMEWQINALSHTGLLSRFVGMLTDSRSFLSAPRHEYFRRILCNMVGRDMHEGRLPLDYELVGGMIRRICYANADAFFGMDVPHPSLQTS